MSPADLPAPADQLAAVALAVAVEAADRARAARAAGFAVDTKSTATDLVTEVDRATDAWIRAALLERRPDDGLLTEEDDGVDGRSGIVWVVDPIDGTTNFVHGIAPYAVSIAATVDGDQPVAGVVVEIAHDQRFVAALGHGATLDGRPLRCATDVPLARALVATGFGYDPARRERQAAVVGRIIGSIADVRRFGAAAMDLCSVAAGRVTAYYEAGLSPWDLAAGRIVATEAGAVVEAIEGGPPRPDSVLAAPAALVDPLRELLVSAGAHRVLDPAT